MSALSQVSSDTKVTLLVEGYAVVTAEMNVPGVTQLTMLGLGLANDSEDMFSELLKEYL